MDLSCMRAKSHHAAQDSCTSHSLLSRLQGDPFVERPAFMFICFTDEDAQQCAFMWKFHGYLLLVTETLGENLYMVIANLISKSDKRLFDQTRQVQDPI